MSILTVDLKNVKFRKSFSLNIARGPLSIYIKLWSY